MTIDRIARCIHCVKLEFVDREGRCEFCQPTAEILYATGMITASTRPVAADEPEAA